MRSLRTHTKKIASFLLVILLTEIVGPTTALALTSGPSQPEMKGFEPIGASDMVDLFSGDFSYNIPLLDVGGYPVNLVYHSGSSADEEASWVGYGWTLSPGIMNRQLRGLPDDFNGSDKQIKTVHIKDHITKGASVSATLDALGIPVPKFKLKRKKKTSTFSMNPTVSLGITFDNYRGVGVNIGLNSGLNLTEQTAGTLTTSGEAGATQQVLNSDTSHSTGTNFNLNLSSFDGASIGLSQNFTVIQKHNETKEKTGISNSIGIGYNTRQGLGSLTLSTIPTQRKDAVALSKTLRGGTVSTVGSGISSEISFAGETYTPSIENATRFDGYTFTFNGGPELWLILPGLGVTGFYNKQKTIPEQRSFPIYGFMYSHKGLENEANALMDFNREKDIPYSKAVNYLPVPVPTYDLFVANSQDGSGQYRAYKGSSGVLFDAKTENTTDNTTLGIELGASFYVDAGADLYKQTMKTITRKWTDRNNFLPNGDYQQSTAASPLFEPTYFKRVGEPVPADADYLSKVKNSEPVGVVLSKNISNPLLGAEAKNQLRSLSSPNGENIPATLKRNKREVRNTTFSYLTAKEAVHHALDKKIKDYHPDSLGLSSCSNGGVRNYITRTAGYRAGHHISEITITGDDGKRSIYGIPVYNTYQEDVTFSVAQNLALRNRGLIYYSGTDASASNVKGRENYYSKEVTPPYATSYLLTAMLSPDYVDLKSDGITDDDLGTAVKFNYTKLSTNYKWRTPYSYSSDSANYSEGLLSDDKDDKANYIYGERETWYMHSIESKTMVAYFIMNDRDDALGVTGPTGAIASGNKLKKLAAIKLFSKSDLLLHGGNPLTTTPIKTVHFEYDYSICQNQPNSSAASGGKLTLKRVYFTFGNNAKGQLNSYRFNYDTTNYNQYNYRQYDRWGNFKDASSNPAGMNNGEYPYTLQDTALGNKFSSVGQLTQIKLPSGGTINVTYESDDYAYVQDKRADIMCKVAGAKAVGDSTGLVSSNTLFIKLPFKVSTQADMIYRYFQDLPYLYFKCFLDLDNKGHKEFVPGYAAYTNPTRINDSVARVTLTNVQGTNPITKAGWQFLRLNLPKWAYPGSDNFGDDGSDLIKAIKALLTAFKTITEIFKGYEKKAKSKKYSDRLDLGKSWVRLSAPTLKKLGGGSRVKKIVISDDWENMSGATGAKTTTLTQVYSYTTNDSRGNTISSGVASYEPMLGNDENPFRQPIAYSQNNILGLDNFLYIERPMGESFFPSASVGYGKVTVKSIGSGDDESVNRTGTSVSEFYTAKDFPTKVSELGIDKKRPIVDKLFKLIGGINVDHVGLSQGYAIETNDMHGKPKSVNISNKSGQTISSVEYFYKVENELAASKKLSNTVKVIDSTGNVSDAIIGVDAEIYTDMRQQTSDNLGVSVKVSGGVGAILIFPLPFFFPGIGVNYDRRNYRSSSTVKIINRFSIQYKTKKVENGSSITTENVLWDAETGNVIETKTQNEFDDPVYSFAYPAHWVYGRMGQAYQNLGTMLTGFTTGSNGVISNSTYNSLLIPGDELIDVSSANKYWVINSPVSSTYQKRIIDKNGNIQSSLSGLTLKLLRSGKRNMANTAIASLTSLKDPIVNGKLDVSQLTKILDAKATVFSEEWSVPVAAGNGEVSTITCGTISESCMEKFIHGAMVIRGKNITSFFYSTSTSPAISADSIMDYAYGGSDTICRTGFLNGQSASTVGFYQYHVTGSGWTSEISSHDSAYFGGCTMHFDSVKPRFNLLANKYGHVDSLRYGCVAPCGSFIDVVPDSSVTCGYLVIEKSCGGEGGLADVCYLPDTVMRFHLACPLTATGCISPVDQVLNPYYKGLLGNWRPKAGYAYQIDRENFKTDPSKLGSTDIRKSGAYSVFNPFWKRNTYWEMNPTNDIRWIAASETLQFNTKGMEVESKDALNRYSAAVFGYLESVPTAVASNARYREIGYDGFEDYGFNLDCNRLDSCNNQGHFKYTRLINGSSIDTTSTYAHTGKYSLKLSANATLVKTVFTGEPEALYTFDGQGRYVLGSNEQSKGFSPIPGKKYVLSFWVKDTARRNPSTYVGVTVNGSGLVNSLSAWPIVEGWKQVQVQFVLSSLATGFTLAINPGSSTVYVDDIRIQPFDGQMKTFAYDASSQRLMAELDENNFASFYEYDDEGILIRVKKETERGIMTIKETRSSYRKQ